MKKPFILFMIVSLFYSFNLARAMLFEDCNHTVLHKAAEKGDEAQINFLLRTKWKRKINNMNSLGYSPLHLATKYGHLPVVRILLEAGADINQTVTRNGTETAFDLALEQDCSDELLTCLFSRNDRNKYRLISYADKGNYRAVLFLLNHDSCLDKDDKSRALCYSADLDVAKALLQHGADVNGVGEDNPLMKAVYKGRQEITSFLVDQGACINALDKRLNTPLHEACSRTNRHIITILLEKNADPNARNKKGRTPFHQIVENFLFYESAESTLEEMIALFLKYKAEINVADEELTTPLHIACERTDRNVFSMHPSKDVNAFRVISTLLAHGADVNAKNKKGLTPFYQIVKSLGSNRYEKSPIEEIISLFLEHDVEMNVTDEELTSPLHIACENASPHIIAKLVMQGADVNARNKKGLTPFYLIVRSLLSHRREQHIPEKMIPLFLKHKAEVNIADEELTTPLHIACKSRNRPIIAKIVAQGANMNAKNKMGLTPFHLVVESADEKLISFFLRGGADVNAQDNEGFTPLHLAFCPSRNYYYKERILSAYSDSAKIAIVKSLLKRKADVNLLDHKQSSPFDLALETGAVNCAAIMLQWGANVNYSQKERAQPLLLATKNQKCHPLVYLLLKQGASVDLCQGEWRNPLNEAWRARYSDIVRVLLEHGAIGSLPLKETIAKQEPVIVQYLLDRGAKGEDAMLHDALDTLEKDPKKRFRQTDKTNPHQGIFLIIEALLKYGANPNTADQKGRTPLGRINDMKKLNKSNKFLEIENILKDAGATLYIPDAKSPALHSDSKAEYANLIGHSLFSFSSDSEDEELSRILEIISFHEVGPAPQSSPQSFKKAPALKWLCVKAALQMFKGQPRPFELFQHEIEDKAPSLMDIFFPSFKKGAFNFLKEYLKDSAQYMQKVQTHYYPFPSLRWYCLKTLIPVIEKNPKKFKLSSFDAYSLSSINLLYKVRGFSRYLPTRPEDYLVSWLNKTASQEKAELERKEAEKQRARRRYAAYERERWGIGSSEEDNDYDNYNDYDDYWD